MRARRRRLGAVLVVLVVVLGAACSGGTEEEAGPDYEPVPDRELFAQVARIPGVVEVDLEFQDTFTSGRGYVGTVSAGPGVDPLAVLDQTLAVLRQGRYRAGINVEVRQGGRATTLVDLGVTPTERGLVKRYGPQPGDGSPPEQGQP